MVLRFYPEEPQNLRFLEVWQLKGHMFPDSLSMKIMRRILSQAYFLQELMNKATLFINVVISPVSSILPPSPAKGDLGGAGRLGRYRKQADCKLTPLAPLRSISAAGLN